MIENMHVNRSSTNFCRMVWWEEGERKEREEEGERKGREREEEGERKEKGRGEKAEGEGEGRGRREKESNVETLFEMVLNAFVIIKCMGSKIICFHGNSKDLGGEHTWQVYFCDHLLVVIHEGRAPGVLLHLLELEAEVEEEKEMYMSS